MALQGPTSGGLLRSVADADIDGLRYFRMTSGAIEGVPVQISRTGYTGDLGYEIWIEQDGALQVWDALMTRGTAFDIRPTGMLALDVARIEAGLLLVDVDFNGSRKSLIDAQRYSPYEMGLGRLVSDGKGPFVGRMPLRREKGADRNGRSRDSRSRGRRSRPSTRGSGSRRRCRQPRRERRCRCTAEAGRSARRRPPPGRPC